MIIIGDTKIPSIDELSDSNLRVIINEIIKFAKTNPQGHERETFDFKREINVRTNEEKYKVRKWFASFANTRGGIIIVGISNNLSIEGVKPKKYQKMKKWLKFS
jgi:predicted HTH transcriptional regulator